MELDELDLRLLDILPAVFPPVSRPYAKMAERLGGTEDEIFERVQRMRQSGLVRRLGANFQSTKLGFVSTLCAAKVPEDRLDAFVTDVNAQPGVTHNYLRDHAYNVWFTLISPSREAERETLEGIERRTGIDVLNLPATKFFKIRVDFKMNEE